MGTLEMVQATDPAERMISLVANCFKQFQRFLTQMQSCINLTKGSIVNKKSFSNDQVQSSFGFRALERVIFDSRYALVLIYVMGIIMNMAFTVKFLIEGVDLIPHMMSNSIEKDVIILLSVLDAAMVANVVYLILAGSYVVYVKPKISNDTFGSADQRPLALQHLTPGTLKEKMASSLIGVSSVNLLVTMIDLEEGFDWKVVAGKVVIHGMLIIGYFVFAKTNRASEALALTEHNAASEHSDKH